MGIMNRPLKILSVICGLCAVAIMMYSGLFGDLPRPVYIVAGILFLIATVLNMINPKRNRVKADGNKTLLVEDEE